MQQPPLNDPSPPDQLGEFVTLARKGAMKASRQIADSDEFNSISQFVGSNLEAGDDAAMLAVATQLRHEDRRALAWYMQLVRTLSGTVPVDSSIRHLVFIPALATPALLQPLALKSSAHEIAGSLEHALDLGAGTLQLHARSTSLESLEQLTASQCRSLCTGHGGVPLDASGSGAFVITGIWTVPLTDRPRLSRKLVHALQLTPDLVAWRVRTEALLEESGQARIRVFPMMQLQDVFMGLRQLRLSEQVEAALKTVDNPQTMSWLWDAQQSLLKWKLAAGSGDLPWMTTSFPDEPVELIESHLQRLAQRLKLTLTPLLVSR